MIDVNKISVYSGNTRWTEQARMESANRTEEQKIRYWNIIYIFLHCVRLVIWNIPNDYYV